MKDFFSPLIENAIRLSNYWHQGQKRRESDFDYFTHLVEVGMILSRANFDEEVIAVGLTHHLLDNTECPNAEIVAILGQKIFQTIEILKEEEVKTSEEWKIIKERHIEKIKRASEEIKAICVADRIANAQVMLEVLQEKGMSYFDNFVVGPEDLLWFEDNMCMTLQENWEHPLLAEYDRLIDDFVEVLEKLDEGENLKDSPKKTNDKSELIADFDKPVEERKLSLKKFEKREPAPLPSINKVIERKRKYKSLVVSGATKGLYLTDEEYKLILPAVLQLSISKEKISNQMLQEKLKINYLTGYKVLKELKRLHIIKKADSAKPREVDVSKAGELLRELTK